MTDESTTDPAAAGSTESGAGGAGPTEAERLEALWAGRFGDDYVQRNDGAYGHREHFWVDMLGRLTPRRLLEVGCNVGGNLEWLAPRMEPGSVYGIDVNRSAIERIRGRLPSVSSLWGPARDLPFRDRWFDLVFTMGVLIHQPDVTLPLVMAEMVRCSDRFVLCGEYHAAEPQEVGYRGQRGALFRRDYGRLFREMFPELHQVDTGFLSSDDGWDDVTWWLFERT
ncbi:MAG: methyltransferase domain-containing protein [Actinobacteria bacterium]|nr:methyltransferase domain-containing protein [Actinomycetota bacterium]